MEELGATGPTRYRFDHDSEVSAALLGLEAAINTAGPISEDEPSN